MSPDFGKGFDDTAQIAYYWHSREKEEELMVSSVVASQALTVSHGVSRYS